MTTCAENELSFVEEFKMISPQSDFAIFIFTLLGIIFGINFSKNMEGVLYFINCVTSGVIGFLFGVLVKRVIDNYQSHSELQSGYKR